MNGRDLLTGLGSISPEFYEEAEKEVCMEKQKNTRTVRGTVGKIFVAAAIITALAVTASAAGLGWFHRYFEERSAGPLSQTEAAFVEQMEQPIGQSQTQDGYTLTVKSAITDGRMAYINIGITAPEGQVLSKTVIPGYNPDAPAIDAGNFGPDLLMQAQGTRMTGSMSLTTLEDFDGRDNTQDWLLTAERDGEMPFAPGNVWKLHIEDLIATYQDDQYQQELNKNSGSKPGTLMALTQEEAEKLNPRVTLAEGAWDFEIEFKACDSRIIELIKEPVSAPVYIAGFEKDSTGFYEEVRITSLTLGTLSATITADTKYIPEFSNVVDNQYVQVVMKDGSQIRLRPSSGMSGQQKLEAERPIMLDNVDHILLADGTRLPMP